MSCLFHLFLCCVREVRRIFSLNGENLPLEMGEESLTIYQQYISLFVVFY